MFKNRSITLKLEKPNVEEATEEHHDERPIEEKAAAVLHVFEKVAVKVFAGVIIYVLVDTRRQVKVERAKHPSN